VVTNIELKEGQMLDAAKKKRLRPEDQIPHVGHTREPESSSLSFCIGWRENWFEKLKPEEGDVQELRGRRIRVRHSIA